MPISQKEIRGTTKNITSHGTKFGVRQRVSVLLDNGKIVFIPFPIEIGFEKNRQIIIQEVTVRLFNQKKYYLKKSHTKR